MSNNIEKIIPATFARKNFFTLLKNLQKPGRYFTITLEGRPVAVFLSFSEFNSWKETIEVANDKELAADLKEAKDYKFKSSDFIPLEDILKREGFLVAERPNNEYVPSRAKKKSRKRIK